jgi:hypothetical protein
MEGIQNFGNGLNALHFENVVKALDLSPYSSNVSLVQKFRSRAEKQKRDEITFSVHYDMTEQEEDDNEDELKSIRLRNVLDNPFKVSDMAVLFGR